MTRNQVFISYGHQDQSKVDWLSKLQEQLSIFQRQGILNVWNDRQIASGSRWRDQIKQAVERAKVAVLLVGPRLLESKFIEENEFPPLLKAAEKEGVQIFPLVVCKCPYKDSVLGPFQPFNDPDQPLEDLPEPEQDKILNDISIAIVEAFSRIPKELEMLRQLFEQSLDLLCFVDFQGHFTYVNPAFVNSFKYTLEELLTKPFIEFIDPRDHATTYTEYGKLLAGAKTIFFENRYRCKDGSLKRIQWNATPLVDEKVIHAVGRDVTALRKREVELNHFFEQSLDLLCLVGLDGHFKSVNPAFLLTLGYTAEEAKEFLEKPFIEFIDPRDHAATYAEYGKLLAGAKTIFFENRYRCKDGSLKRIQWNAVSGPNEGLIYAVGRDVTNYTTTIRSS